MQLHLGQVMCVYYLMIQLVLIDIIITNVNDKLGDKNIIKGEYYQYRESYFCICTVKKCSPLDEARYKLYCKKRKSPTLKSLPPTEANFAYVLRAHL